MVSVTAITRISAWWAGSRKSTGDDEHERLQKRRDSHDASDQAQRTAAPPGARGSGHGDADTMSHVAFRNAVLGNKPLEFDVYRAVENVDGDCRGILVFDLQPEMVVSGCKFDIMFRLGIIGGISPSGILIRTTRTPGSGCGGPDIATRWSHGGSTPRSAEGSRF